MTIKELLTQEYWYTSPLSRTEFIQSLMHHKNSKMPFGKNIVISRYGRDLYELVDKTSTEEEEGGYIFEPITVYLRVEQGVEGSILHFFTERRFEYYLLLIAGLVIGGMRFYFDWGVFISFGVFVLWCSIVYVFWVITRLNERTIVNRVVRQMGLQKQ